MINNRAPWCHIAVRKQLRSGKRIFELDVRLQLTQPRVVLTGPSGIGKTTVLRMLAGLVRPDSGHIKMGGATLFDSAANIDHPPQERKVGFMFQHYALLPHLTALGNVGFGLRRGMWGFLSRAQKHESMQWLERFHLENVAHQFPHTLSGGQRQRLALARLAILQPRVLVLDEPFAALDPDLRQSMRQEVDKLLETLNIPLIMVSHDQEDHRALAAQEIRLSHENGKTVNA